VHFPEGHPQDVHEQLGFWQPSFCVVVFSCPHWQEPVHLQASLQGQEVFPHPFSERRFELVGPVTVAILEFDEDKRFG